MHSDTWPPPEPKRFRKRRRRRTATWLLSALLVMGLVAGGLTAWNTLSSAFTGLSTACSAPLNGTDYELAPDQAGKAALIAAIAQRRSMPPRAVTIGIAVAMQESKLRNISYGDRDSVGMFQQRPSQGWGSPEQLMDPVFAINAFFDHLAALPGYQDMAITEAGQAVQRSAYPLAYGQHESMARAFSSALTGYSPAALSCVLPQPQEPGDPALVIQALQSGFGDAPAQSTAPGTVRLTAASETAGWQLAQWAVANANDLQITEISYNGSRWQRQGSTDPGWQATGAGEQPVSEVLITVQRT